MVMVLVIVVAALVIIIVVVMVMVLVIVVAALVIIVVIVMVMVLVCVAHHFVGAQQALGALDHVQHLLAGELVPGGGDDAGVGVVLPQQVDALLDALLGGVLGAAEDDGLGVFDLVDEELAEVLGVHAALADIGNGGAALEGDFVAVHHVHHHAADVGELAHAGGFDDDAVGMIGADQLVQRAAEVAHQRAADAAGVQLGDLDAGIAHEAAVHADLAVFVLQQYHLLALEGAAQQLLDQRGLACAEETGNDIDLRHDVFTCPVHYSSIVAFYTILS